MPNPKLLLLAPLLAAALAGCVDNASDLQASAVRPASASPAGASVAFVSLEGAPAEIAARFSQLAAAEAARRDVALAPPAAAHYLVRGYLSATPAEGGTAFTYVWDVFDKSRQRIQRTQDSLFVKTPAANPWSAADERVLASLAARSADDLAAVLAQTPEALAARAAPAAIAASAAPAATLPASLRAFH